MLALLSSDLKTQLQSHPAYVAAENSSIADFQKLILAKAKLTFSGDADRKAKYASLGARKVAQYNKQLNPAEREACDHIKKLGSNVVFRSRYLRYSANVPAIATVKAGNTPVTLTVDDCLTKFYIPYVVEPRIGWAGPMGSNLNFERNAAGLVRTDDGGGGDGDAGDDDEPIDPTPRKRPRKGATTTSSKPAKKAKTTPPDAPAAKKAPFNIDVFRTNLDNSYNATARNSIAISAPVKYNLGIAFDSPNPTTRKPFDPNREKIWRFNLCGELFDRAQEYLGVEVFTNRFLADKTAWKRMINPTVFLKAHVQADNSLEGGGPRLFIVGSDQYLIGDAPLKGPDKTVTPAVAMAAAMAIRRPDSASVPLDKKFEFRPRRKVIDSTIRADGQRFPTRTENSHNKNSASIVCMVLEAMGNDTSSDGRDYFKIHHFLGGDALWDVEGGLAAWLQNNKSGRTPVNWPCKSEAMKLSHHGGKESMQTGLVGALSPNFIISSNPGGGEYCHPHGETLAYLDAAIAALRYADRKVVQKVVQDDTTRKSSKYTWTDRYSPLLMTNYPGAYDKQCIGHLLTFCRLVRDP